MCENCIFNVDGFCKETCRDDLDEINECSLKIPLIDLAFFYDETVEKYRCVAYLDDKSSNKIIKSKIVTQEDLIEMLNREKGHLAKKNSVIGKIKEQN